MAVIYILNTYNLKVCDELIMMVEEKRQQRIKKMTNIVKQKELLGAGILLKNTLENMFITNYEICYNEYNKPFLKDLPYHFSISHSNGVVALVVSSHNVGIDIEVIKDVKENVVKKVLSIDELKIYQTLSKSDKTKYFYQIFCAKESFSKMCGTGISFNLQDIKYDEVVLKEIKINNDSYMLALTGNEPFKVIERYIENKYKERN